MSEGVAKLEQRVRFRLLWWLCRSVAIQPYFMQYYVLQEIIYFVLRFVVRYRHRLIVRQLSDSFPEKGPQEIRSIAQRYYLNLAEMIVNTLALAGMSEKECRRRMHFERVEELENTIGDRDAVGLTSHYGFWEYYGFLGILMQKYILIGAYHKIKDSVVDEAMFRMRDKNNCLPVSSKELIRFYIRHAEKGYKGRRMLIGLISDQNSPRHGECHWYRFLNHDTLFFEGGEQLATKYNLPVFYFDMQRIKRGYYKGRWVQIYDGTSPVEKYEITERYVRLLEQTITAQPDLWMWSHNRWKFRREPSEMSSPQQTANS